MLITVIVPVYNVKPYLREALDSVINQTYRDLEIIIVDDGSTDGGGEICDEYAAKDSRVKVIRQENKGLAAARNVGLDMMQGEAVCFLDSDDYYYPQFVEKMLAAMQEENADMVVCRHIYRTTDGREEIACKVKAGRYTRLNALRGLVIGALPMFACIRLYRRRLWRGLRFPVGQAYEDMAIAYEIVNLCGKVYVVDDVLYLYRGRQGSISHVLSLPSICDHIRAGIEIDQFVDRHKAEIFADSPKGRYRTMLEKIVLSYVDLFSHLEQVKKSKIRVDLPEGNEMDIDNLATIMSTEAGRQFFAEVLDLCGAGAVAATGNYAQDFYSLGRRSVGEDMLRAVRMIEAGGGSSDGLALEYMMLREHKQRQEENENG